jgi:putative acyl-CoA dehydrogenase
VRFAPPALADAFCASRLEDGPAGAGRAFGVLPQAADAAAIIARARVA